MKKIMYFLMAALMLLWGAAIARAAAPLLTDDAQLLTQQEALAVINTLESASQALGMDVAVVTVESLENMRASAYADRYYDDHGYRDDGILLLVSVGDRQWSISAAGAAMDKVSDSECEKIGDQITDDLRSGDYSGAFLRFPELVKSYAENGEGFDAGWLVCVGIGILVGLISVFVMKAQLKSVRPKGTASDYVVGGSFHLTQSNELYLYSNVSRVERSQSSSSHGGGSSGSGRSHGGASGRF